MNLNSKNIVGKTDATSKHGLPLGRIFIWKNLHDSKLGLRQGSI